MSILPVPGSICECCGGGHLATHIATFTDPFDPQRFHVCTSCADEVLERGIGTIEPIGGEIST
ncbi:hypothetical protein VV02_05290 [Luteipulveratus mongoliensis]|uniref:Uncharacterized protein n=1 Tax=Luteipulveratus mongoliensis TaxID=571913 RepID=A0A0K1JFB6_9MICO|nr:hypothetical protein VV02_05290 [Luteipulveratus mongoliensis]